jgi:hypothetical protein
MVNLVKKERNLAWAVQEQFKGGTELPCGVRTVNPAVPWARREFDM